MAVIYGVLCSPPTRSALWTAELVGLDYTMYDLDMMNQEHKSEKYLRINPAHTIPSFVDDDGYTIIDSHSIVTYIVDKYAKDDSLYPKDLKKRALVNSMLHFDNASLWPIVYPYVKDKFFGKPVEPENEAAFKDRLNTLNVFLGQRPYAAGEGLTVADLCIASTLSVIKSFGTEDKARLVGDYPHLARWHERMKAEVPFYDKILVKGTTELEELMTFMKVQAAKSAK